MRNKNPCIFYITITNSIPEKLVIRFTKGVVDLL